MDNSLEDIRKNWEKETDNFLIKAATVDKKEYPLKVQEIILNEIRKRGLENAQFEKAPLVKNIVPDLFPELYDGMLADFNPKYSYISKIFRPAIIFFNAYCGVLGVLIAFGLRKLFYKEVEVEEDIICKKTKNRPSDGGWPLQD